jgi:hypothetical protein
MENTLRTGSDYWAALEAPFLEFLQQPSETAELKWTTTLFRSARQALERSASQYVASSARDLQAHVKGMARLDASLKKLEKEFYPEEETEVTP